jgi:hypothetical protein
MNREKSLEKLKKEVSVWGYHKIADRIGINFVTLWRIVNEKYKFGGSATTWDAIFRYYK